MRIAQMNPNPIPRSAELPEEDVVRMNISFTANAINYLSSTYTAINLKEWIWHEEVIDGEMYCVITDRMPISTDKS